MFPALGLRLVLTSPHVPVRHRSQWIPGQRAAAMTVRTSSNVRVFRSSSAAATASISGNLKATWSRAARKQYFRNASAAAGELAIRNAISAAFWLSMHSITRKLVEITVLGDLSGERSNNPAFCMYADAVADFNVRPEPLWVLIPHPAMGIAVSSLNFPNVGLRSIHMANTRSTLVVPGGFAPVTKPPLEYPSAFCPGPPSIQSAICGSCQHHRGGQ